MKRRLSGICSVLLLASCSLPPSGSGESPRAGGVLPVEGTAEAPDGLRISFESRGSGATALVFVHCWACDRSFWKEQVEVLADRYRVVTLDLAGHGKSGRDRGNWSIAGLAADVEAVVTQLGLDACVLIGHSLGGPVSLLAAARMPDRVIGVIGVDTIHSVNFEFPKQAVENLVDGFEADFVGMMKTAVAANFPADADPEIREWVTTRALGADPEVVLAIARDFPNFNSRAALARVEVPVRCINAEPYSASSFETDIEANRKVADFDAVLMQGVGHYLMLEDPEGFNRLLTRTIYEITRGGD